MNITTMTMSTIRLILIVWESDYQSEYLSRSRSSCFPIPENHIPCGGGSPINSQKIHLLLKHHIPKEHKFFEKSGFPSKGPAKDFRNLGHPQTAQPRHFKTCVPTKLPTQNNLCPFQRPQPRTFQNLGHPQRAQPRHFKNLGPHPTHQPRNFQNLSPHQICALARASFLKICALARASFLKICALARASFLKICALARASFLKICALARASFLKICALVCALARASFLKICALAPASFLKICALARASFLRHCALARAIFKQNPKP